MRKTYPMIFQRLWCGAWSAICARRSRIPRTTQPEPIWTSHRGSGRCHGNSKPLFHDGLVAWGTVPCTGGIYSRGDGLESETAGTAARYGKGEKRHASAAFFGVDALQKALDRTDSRHKKVGAAERKCGCSRCGTDAVRSLCVGWCFGHHSHVRNGCWKPENIRWNALPDFTEWNMPVWQPTIPKRLNYQRSSNITF